MQINPNKLTTADFYFGQTLGEGAYARVVYGKLKAFTCGEFAIKIMEKNHIKREDKVKYVMMEKNILAKLSSPFIIKLFYTFQDTNYLYMCMELVPGGELRHLINKRRRAYEEKGIENQALDFESAQFYAAEILLGIEYMHNQGVIHRDLKPENILVDAGGHLKIGDFGTALLTSPSSFPQGNNRLSAAIDAEKIGALLSAQAAGSRQSVGRVPSKDEAAGAIGAVNLGTNEVIDEEMRGSFVGTAEYVSPEVLQDREVTPAIDIWAYGCIVYQMLFGKPPFRGDSEYLIFQSIINHCDGSSPLQFPTVCSNWDLSVEKLRFCKCLIQQTLQVNPSARYIAVDVDVERLPNHIPEEGLPEGFSRQTLTDHVFFTHNNVNFDAVMAQKIAPPFVPDASTFPSQSNMADGATDDWQLGVETQEAAEDSDEEAFRGGKAGVSGGYAYSSEETIIPSFAVKEQWTHYFAEGEHQILTGLVHKRKGMFSKKRRLILTDKPRLFYIEPKTFEYKGEIPWSPEHPVTCFTLNEKQFDILSTRTGRRYHMTIADGSGTTQMWTDLINAVVEKQMEDFKNGVIKTVTTCNSSDYRDS